MQNQIKTFTKIKQKVHNYFTVLFIYTADVLSEVVFFNLNFLSSVTNSKVQVHKKFVLVSKSSQIYELCSSPAAGNTDKTSHVLQVISNHMITCTNTQKQIVRGEPEREILASLLYTDCIMIDQVLRSVVEDL